MTNRTLVRTGVREIDALVPLIGSFLEADVLEMTIDGKEIRGFRTPDAKSLWIRDHCDMLRVGRYFLSDVTSAVQHFAETQSASGRIFDYFSTFPEKLPSEKENWTKYVRVPVEADVEYRFVKAAYLAWQASGDDEWLAALLPRMERALNYIREHEWYWDDKYGLVKRAYTIDTWDFAYTAGQHEWLQFQIDENTFWGVMHGDNSGYYEAYRIMATLYDRFGDAERAGYWRDQAGALRGQMNELCWNGRFYTHFVKLGPVEIPGFDESAQLSLSNPMDINRGAATHEMAVSIIEEYRRRRSETDAFAEWFSIDPPFPDGIFGDEKLVGGAYVNGGIMPLVGGELAKAAFDHGFETYGVDILRRYHSLVSQAGETYLWYFPDGTPASVETSTSPEAQPTDGWGSSAMLYALIAGLAGIEDLGACFEEVRLAPRWPAAGVDRAEVRIVYESSGSQFGYAYRRRSKGIKLVVHAPGTIVHFHVLVPADATPRSVSVAGDETPFRSVQIEESRYLDFAAHVSGEVKVKIGFS
ncbi:MAG: hypothetical protein PVJ64_01420 [Gemmatimonadales bacterium]|jgi:hypothetical protein